MPSPRGTNVEHLAMPDAVAAYDAALGDDVMRKLADFLSDKLTPQDLATVKSILGEDDEPASAAAEDQAYHAKMREMHRSGLINDNALISALHGRAPRPSTAADEARRREMFPHWDRIKVG
jgi:hypothetical protein